MEPGDLAVEDEAAGHAIRIKLTSTGEQTYHISRLQGELRILERNVANGYADAYNGFRIAVIKRTLQLLGVAA